MKIANAQNNTFASPNSRAEASACKRVVFLPPHPSPPTTHMEDIWNLKSNFNVSKILNNNFTTYKLKII